MKTELIKCPWALVAVHWIDAFDGENGWTEVEKYEPARTTVVTVGFLWPDCLQGYLTLVSSYMPDEVPDLKITSGPVHIPLGMVLKIVLLDQPEIDLEECQHEFSQTPDAPSLDCQQTQGTLHNVSSPHPAHPRLSGDGNETNLHGRSGSPDHVVSGNNPRWLLGRLRLRNGPATS